MIGDHSSPQKLLLTTVCMSGLLLRQPSFKPGSGESTFVFHITSRFVAGDVISLEIGAVIEEYQKNPEETSKLSSFPNKAMISI